MPIRLFFLCLSWAGIALAVDTNTFVPDMDRGLRESLASARAKEIEIFDMHIHLRGGMTAEKAAVRQIMTGIRSGVLENHGRDWPLADNSRLERFLEEVDTVRKCGVEIFVGIQVNDRDWFKVINPELLAKLDFVLADTMILGTDREGRPCKLWLEDRYDIDDVEAWMKRYVDHHLQILDEPVTILANPTFLPKKIADRYAKLWTKERMELIIDKAVEKNIAIEIQAGSAFPSTAFLKLAKSKGAKFSFGTNNHDAKPIDMSRWFRMIDELGLTRDNLYIPKRND